MSSATRICFDCAQCGRCCNDLRLTLSLDEAIVWACNGHQVQLLCEAIPWPRDPLPTELELPHRRDTSFAVEVGRMLVAFHDGACPHLQTDMRCGNYADRPRICRIYPLESRPFAPMAPASRKCPDEAWTAQAPVLLEGGVIADPTAEAIVAARRQARIDDAAALEAACAQLGISTAAFAGEGMAVHTPDPDILVRSLRQSPAPSAALSVIGQWEIVTNRQATLKLLRKAQCPTRMVSSAVEFLGSFEPDI